MVVVFENAELESLYQNGKGRGKQQYSDKVINKFSIVVQIMESSSSTNELRKFKFLHFEKLSGHFYGKFSVRVQDEYRIIFRIEKDKLLIEEIHIEDMSNHDYRNKL